MLKEHQQILKTRGDKAGAEVLGVNNRSRLPALRSEAGLEREAKKEQLARTLGDLVRFETVADGTPEHIAQIRGIFDYVGSRVQEAEAQTGKSFLMREYNDGSNLLSLIVTPKDEGRNEEEVLLHPNIAVLTHLDVVPAQEESLFEMKRDGDFLIGRGVLDMKGIVPPLLDPNFLNNMPKGCALVFTSDEETGGYHGAKYLRDLGFKPGFLIIVDGQKPETISYGSKGLWHSEVAFTSLLQKGGHGSRPHDYGANNLVANFIHTLDANPNYSWENLESPPDTTVTFGKLGAPGGAVNKVAEYAMTTMDWRFPTEEQKGQMLEDVKSALVETLKAKLPLAYKGKVVPEVVLTESQVEGKRRFEVQVVPDGQASYTVATLETLVEGPIYSVDKNDPRLQRFIQLIEETTGKEVPLNERDTSGNDGRWFDSPAAIYKLAGSGSHESGEQVDLNSVFATGEVIEQFMQEFSS